MTKPRKRKAREFLIGLSCAGTALVAATWYGNGRRWFQHAYPTIANIIRVREVLPRKRGKRT